MNQHKKSNQSKYSFILYLFSFFLTGCMDSSGPKEISIGDISYRMEDSSITISNFNRNSALDDSIFHLVYRLVLIEQCDSETIMRIINRLNDSVLLSLKIHDYPGVTFSFDFSKFSNLNSLSFEGSNSKKSEIRFGKQMEWLDISTSDTCFPSFGPNFTNIHFLLINGNYSYVPQWIENITNLERARFYSDGLQEIKCDLCKLKSLNSFDISETPIYSKELKYFKAHGKYLQLERFKACNGALKFEHELMPQ